MPHVSPKGPRRPGEQGSLSRCAATSTKYAQIKQTLDFNYRVFNEGMEIMEMQFPEDRPMNLHDEAHFPAARRSVTYLKGSAALGLGRGFTA